MYLLDSRNRWTPHLGFFQQELAHLALTSIEGKKIRKITSPLPATVAETYNDADYILLCLLGESVGFRYNLCPY